MVCKNPEQTCCCENDDDGGKTTDVVRLEKDDENGVNARELERGCEKPVHLCGM